MAVLVGASHEEISQQFQGFDSDVLIGGRHQLEYCPGNKNTNSEYLNTRPWRVDFDFGQVDCQLTCPDGQVKIFGQFFFTRNIQLISHLPVFGKVNFHSGKWKIRLLVRTGKLS